MVRPCAKYARLDCYAPLQVTAKTFAVTWSGLFTCAKLATFFGLGLWTCKTKYFYRNCWAPKTSDGKSVVGIFRHVSYTHLGAFWLGIGTWKIKISTSNAAMRRKPEIASMKYAHSLQADACVYRFDALFSDCKNPRKKVKIQTYLKRINRRLHLAQPRLGEIR